MARIALIGAGLMSLAPFSTDMYLSAFPDISNSLKSSPSLVQLSLSVFLAGLTVTQLLYGPISDRYGRKKPLLFGLFLFGLSTFICVTTSNIWIFIAARLLQALGASSGMVISLVLAPDVYTDKKKVGQVLGLLTLVMGVAPIIAPTLGGFILKVFGWRHIFSTLFIYNIILILSVIFALPETKQPNPSVKKSEAFHVYILVSKKQGFLRTTLIRSLGNAGMFVYITAAPFVFMNYFHLSSMSFGILFGAIALALMLGNIVSSIIAKKISYERIFFISVKILFLFSILLGIIGLLIYCGIPQNQLVIVLIPLIGYMFLMGAVLPCSATITLYSQGENTGAASSFLGCITFIFSFISSSIISLFPKGLMPMTLGISICGILAFLFTINAGNLYRNTPKEQESA